MSNIALEEKDSILVVLGSLQICLKPKSYEKLSEVIENVVRDVPLAIEENKRKEINASVSVSLFVGRSTCNKD